MRPGEVRRPGSSGRALVSIVVALHNPGALLRPLLARLVHTAGGTAQVIVIDDASSDGTSEEIATWAAMHPNVVALHNPTRLGVAMSRNLALRVADRTFVWFVDHDDEWDEDALDVFLGAADGETDIVICRAEYRHRADLPGRIIDGAARDAVIGRQELVLLMLDGTVQGFLWSKLIRRSLLGENPFPALTSQSDFAGFVVAAAAAERVVLVSDVLYRYIRHSGSISRQRIPDLENLRIARDSFLTAIDRDATITVPAGQLEFFTIWFYCAAAAFTPIRTGAPKDVRADGRARAQDALRGMRLLPVVRRRPRLGLSMLLVRVASPLYAIVVPLVLRGHDAVRRLRRPSPLRSAA